MKHRRNRDGLADSVVGRVRLPDWAQLLSEVCPEIRDDRETITRWTLQSYGVLVDGRSVEEVAAEHGQSPAAVLAALDYVRNTFYNGENRRLLVELVHVEVPKGERYCRMCGSPLPEPANQYGRPRLYCDNGTCANTASRQRRGFRR
ncbi:hypothetical protein [Nocardia sp. NBC_00511]|uniref:hypothetical protein n=1 Tax=Nocardia sp. NBC_00511 TaxID=2903591 RepID=UPI0030DF3143